MKKKSSLGIALAILSLSSLAFSGPAQADVNSSQVPWWVILVIVVIVLIIVALVLGRGYVEEEPEEMIEVHQVEKSSEAVEEAAVEAPAPVVAEPEPVSSEPVKPDDLRKIEGIGPKISGILQQNGFPTFAALATAEVSALRAVLEAEGLSRLAVPDTWPEQAALASEGKWDELEALQDSLKGGRRS